MSFRENEQFLINRICVHILLLVVFLPHVTRDGEKQTNKKEGQPMARLNLPLQLFKAAVHFLLLSMEEKSFATKEGLSHSRQFVFLYGL